MDVNYFPGRIRLRDKMFRDKDIRNELLKIVNTFDAEQKITYTEKTGSVLVEYDASKIDEEKFKSLFSLFEKNKMKILFYTSEKKDEIIALIKEAGKRLEEN